MIKKLNAITIPPVFLVSSLQCDLFAIMGDKIFDFIKLWWITLQKSTEQADVMIAFGTSIKLFVFLKIFHIAQITKSVTGIVFNLS